MVAGGWKEGDWAAGTEENFAFVGDRKINMSCLEKKLTDFFKDRNRNWQLIRLATNTVELNKNNYKKKNNACAL